MEFPMKQKIGKQDSGYSLYSNICDCEEVVITVNWDKSRTAPMAFSIHFFTNANRQYQNTNLLHILDFCSIILFHRLLLTLNVWLHSCFGLIIYISDIHHLCSLVINPLWSNDAIWIRVNISSGNGLVFTWKQFHKKCSWTEFITCFWRALQYFPWESELMKRWLVDSPLNNSISNLPFW